MSPLEQVVLVAIGVLFCIGTGVFLEHYLGNQPKLNTEELFLCFDLIDVECCQADKSMTADDYDRVRDMRNELYIWMESPGACPISKELSHIIDRVTDIDRTNFD